MNKRRILTGVAVVALAFGAVTPAAQAATSDAAAVTCGNAYWPHSDQDPSGGTVSKSSAAVHTGPYGDCTTVGYVSAGTAVEYDCYVVNDYGNTWTWIRDSSGSSLGWIYDAYLSDGGSSYLC